MRRVFLACVAAAWTACGCTDGAPAAKSSTPGPSPLEARRALPRNPYVADSRVVLNVDVITIPRSAYHRLTALKSYMETAGIYGPGEELLKRNGLMVGRMDRRFEKQFTEAAGALHSRPKQLAVVNLTEGHDQKFEVGGVLRDETVFVWDRSDSVKGRHYRRARYQMALKLEKVREDHAEIKSSWLVNTGPALAQAVSLPELDVYASLGKGQPLVIAPADFQGRGVGRAFLSGLEEQAVSLTFFIITPTEIRQKTETP